MKVTVALSPKFNAKVAVIEFFYAKLSDEEVSNKEEEDEVPVRFEINSITFLSAKYHESAPVLTGEEFQNLVIACEQATRPVTMTLQEYYDRI